MSKPALTEKDLGNDRKSPTRKELGHAKADQGPSVAVCVVYGQTALSWDHLLTQMGFYVMTSAVIEFDPLPYSDGTGPQHDYFLP